MKHSVTLSISILAMVISACNMQSKNANTHNNSDSTTQTASEKLDTAGTNSVLDSLGPQSTWVYSADTNKMSTYLTYFADNKALKKLNLNFPYNQHGGVTVTLTLRNKEKENSVILDASEGIFNGSFNKAGHLRVKFDNNPPESYQFLWPDDGTMDAIYILPVDQFLANLKKSKKIIIEVEFYDNGISQIEFNTDGLTWDH